MAKVFPLKARCNRSAAAGVTAAPQGPLENNLLAPAAVKAGGGVAGSGLITNSRRGLEKCFRKAGMSSAVDTFCAGEKMYTSPPPSHFGSPPRICVSPESSHARMAKTTSQRRRRHPKQMPPLSPYPCCLLLAPRPICKTTGRRPHFSVI